MIQKKLIIIFLLLCLQIPHLLAQASFSPVLTARNGLPNFAKKLKQLAQDSVTATIIGGSITEAENGWRDQTIAWLSKTYPNKSIRQINAGIGVTGSSLGVYLIQEQVLQHQIKTSINPNKIDKFKILDKKTSAKENLDDYDKEFCQIGKISLVNTGDIKIKT